MDGPQVHRSGLRAVALSREDVGQLVQDSDPRVLHHHLRGEGRGARGRTIDEKRRVEKRRGGKRRGGKGREWMKEVSLISGRRHRYNSTQDSKSGRHGQHGKIGKRDTGTQGHRDTGTQGHTQRERERERELSDNC